MRLAEVVRIGKRGLKLLPKAPTVQGSDFQGSEYRGSDQGSVWALDSGVRFRV